MSNVARVAGQAANTLVKPLNVEEVFSTYLYTGTNTTNNIDNGIDLSGEGGLLWIKNRDAAQKHVLFDTERGKTKMLQTNDTSDELTNAWLDSFNSNGFSIALGVSNAEINNTAYDYASWTFRKAPKFFDVVTWTGDGVAGREITHNLGSVPGCIIVKNLTSSAVWNWVVYHRSIGNGGGLKLNTTAATDTNSTFWNNTTPTDSVFTVGSNGIVNNNGDTFVAYLFAHNDGDGEFGPDGDADIIKCGSYTGNGSTDGPEIDLGWEPQWLLIKRATGSSEWPILDSMRGIVSGGNDRRVWANLNSAENTGDPQVKLLPNGFQPESTSTTTNFNGSNYIYIAIRRDTAVPESATDVFAIDTKNSSGDNTDPTWDLGIVTDMAIQKFNKTTSTTPLITSRLTGTQYLKTSETDAETSNSGMNYDHMTGVGTGNGSTTDVNDIVWGWKRAPNYFDVVAYTGDGTSVRNISHNLGVEPEMIWFKVRTDVDNWQVYHKDVGADKASFLDNSNVAQTWGFMNNTAPTSSVFTTTSGYINSASQNYIAYLFASLDGISKVGSYTGNGSSQTIDCGFSAGARFVLIKRTDAAGNWLVVDTERGLVSGNDPVLLLDATNAEQTNLDIVDPTSSGFIVNGSSANWNASGGSYIFYAIA